MDVEMLPPTEARITHDAMQPENMVRVWGVSVLPLLCYHYRLPQTCSQPTRYWVRIGNWRKETKKVGLAVNWTSDTAVWTYQRVDSEGTPPNKFHISPPPKLLNVMFFLSVPNMFHLWLHYVCLGFSLQHYRVHSWVDKRALQHYNAPPL